MKPELNPDQLREIDELIFASHWASAIKSISEYSGISLPDSMESCFARRAELRATSPENFKFTEEEEPKEEFYS